MAWLKRSMPGSPTVRGAREGGPPREGLFIMVHAIGIEADPDLEAVDQNYTVNLQVSARMPAGGADYNERPARLDDAMEGIGCAMADVTGARAFLNSSAGMRPVSLFHLYDVREAGSSAETEGADWLENRDFDVMVANGDA